MKTKKDILYVSIQLILFVCFTFNGYHFIELEWLLLINRIGLIVAIIGVITILIAMLQLNKNLSPFPSPKEEGELISTGLYKLIRHPIYTGIILGALGYGVYKESIVKIVIGLLLYVLFQFKARYEESLLKHKFPNYEKYLLETERFFPNFGNLIGASFSDEK